MNRLRRAVDYALLPVWLILFAFILLGDLANAIGSKLDSIIWNRNDRLYF